MCIISVFKKGVKLSKEELKTCFQNNPDGAGMMWQENGKVHILKGYMDFDSFWEVAKDLPTEVDRAFHFRIATSGKVSAACCHPFEVCNDYKKMSLSDNMCDMAFMHNGVLSEFTPKGGMKSSHSDSMEFGKMVLNGIKDCIDNQTVRDLIELYTPSRFCIMTPETVYLLGSFEQSTKSKAFYSNNSYNGKRYTTCYNYYGGYGGYDTSYTKFYSIGGGTSKKQNSQVKTAYEELLSERYDDYCYKDYSRCFKVKDNGYSEKKIDQIIDVAETEFNIFIYDYQECEGTIFFFFEGKMPDYGYIHLEKRYKNVKPIEFALIDTRAIK